MVRARRADPLPRAARSRAVLGRRLGHARRLPGTGRAAARARPLRAGARPAAARLPQPERRRRLAAVVHVLRARAQHPSRTTRTATSSSGRCSRSRSTCSRPTTRRSSTSRCRSSTRRATRAPSTRRIWQHVERALGVIDAARRSRARGSPPTATATGTTRSSRPIPRMRERLCSAWTVTLHVPDADARWPRRCAASAARARAARWRRLAAQVRDDFQRLLIADGVLAGFAYFRADGGVEHLLHPSDRSTGIHYRLLPMIHAILADLFTPEQARAHVALIRAAPARARRRAPLRPAAPAYRGGPQRHFQRAESSTLLRARDRHHVHPRAPALRRGDGALGRRRRGVPRAATGEPDRLARRRAAGAAAPGATATRRAPTRASRIATRRRRATTRCKAGAIAVEGGWRVYSSGAGIAMRLIRECLLGLRRVALVPDDRSRCCRARSTGCAPRIEVAGAPGRGRATAIASAGPRPDALTCNGAPLAFEARGESVPRGRRDRCDGRVARAARRERQHARRDASLRRGSSDGSCDGRQRAGRAARRFPRPLRLERRRFGAGAARDRAGRRPARQAPAPRLRLPRRRRLRRGAQDVRSARCRRAGRSRCACAARRRRTSSRSSSSIRAGATSGGGTATRSSFPPTGSRCGSAAARSSSPGGRRAAARSRELGAIEIAIAAGPGGTGHASGSRTCASRTSTRRRRRDVRASSALPGHAPAYASRRRRGARAGGASAAPVRSGSRSTSRRSASTADSSSTGSRRGAARAFEVQRSDDGVAWTTLWTRAAGRGRAQLRLPAGRRRRASCGSTCARAPAADGFGIAGIGVRPYRLLALARRRSSTASRANERARPPSALARAASRATGRRSASRAATTCGAPERGGAARGRPRRASRSSRSCSPTGELVTWADARDRAGARATAWLPIPSSRLARRRPRAHARPRSPRIAGRAPSLCVRYRVENAGDAARARAPLRGAAPVPGDAAVAGVPGHRRREPDRASSRWRDGRGLVERRASASSRSIAPSGFGAAAFEQGGVAAPPRARRAAAAHAVTRRVRPRVGRAALGPRARAGRGARGASSRCRSASARPGARDARRAARRPRDAARARPSATGRSGSARRRSASAPRAHRVRRRAAHRDRAHPGRTATARRSSRARGATRARGSATARPWRAALLRMGCADEVRDFLRWYAPLPGGRRQRAVRRRSQRPRLAARARQPRPARLHAWRSTSASPATASSLAELWPAVLRAVGYLESLRAQRLGAGVRHARAARVLRPPARVGRATRATSRSRCTPTGTTSGRCAASATPRDLARVLGDAARGAATRARCATRCGELPVRVDRDDDRGSAASPTCPGSVEWADFDPTATATALATTDAAERLPPAALACTFDEYLARLPPAPATARSTGTTTPPTRSASSARSCASAGATTRTSCSTSSSPTAARARGTSGPRSRGAIRAAPAISATCRTRGSAPSTCSRCSACFAYEHPTNESLVLAAGVSRRVARRRGGNRDREPADLVRARSSYTLAEWVTTACGLSVSGDFETPPGGIVVRSPLPRPLARVTVDGRARLAFRRGERETRSPRRERDSALLGLPRRQSP